jgi:RNA recognition motif-containing protein
MPREGPRLRKERIKPVVGRLLGFGTAGEQALARKGGFDMAKKIYVGNMNYNTSEDTLRQLFAQYGEVVSVNVITDRYTGRAKGFGFVEMATEDAARSAMTALNGKEVDGRQLKVNEANEKPRDSNRSGGGGGNRSRYY